MKIEVLPLAPAELRPKPTDEKALGFGRHFADRMFVMEYASGGWRNARIQKYQPFSLEPSAMCLHYAQEIFEGLKAYRTTDGRVTMFRPAMNIARMNRSAAALQMPQLDPDLFLRALKDLVALERDWIPTTEGCSLYIRPTMIATDPFLGVRPSDTYLFFIIVGPVGAYYPKGFVPVSIMVSENHVRAVRGGIGASKAAANYAASLAGQAEAKKAGFDQVLWLDGVSRKYCEEVGTMNMLFVLDGTVVTAPLEGGTILPGVTRDSVLRLLRDVYKTKVEERPLPIDEVIEGATTGRLQEAFGCGTAAIITAVSEIGYQGRKHKVGNGGVGPIARKLYDDLVGIQYGRKPDPFEWVERVWP
ncbi:MAG: branched-chain amino acid aminotransferase [Deltaproteobacteria bacterium]|nr:branched-chain amino acid aminotransferase [Deltaproteobacteria bacterium]